MPLTFRQARPHEYHALEAMVIDSFEPITWFKKLDERFGPLNGHDWRARWHTRMQNVFLTEMILVGEAAGAVAAFASGTYDDASRLGYIDILAVRQDLQGKGYGREMLRGMLAHLRSLGAEQVNLECLADNDTGNSLYRSEGFVEVARSIRWFRPLSDFTP
jgi:ribosomal protein S18 acetylase RimI-like enzyme